jgi:hypothetical protein
MTLVNSVQEVRSDLLGYKSPLIVNFLQNVEIDAFLQKKEADLLEAAFRPELGQIVGTSGIDFLGSSQERQADNSRYLMLPLHLSSAPHGL